MIANVNTSWNNNNQGKHLLLAAELILSRLFFKLPAKIMFINQRWKIIFKIAMTTFVWKNLDRTKTILNGFVKEFFANFFDA